MRRIIFSLLIAAFIGTASLFIWISYPFEFGTKDVFLETGTVPKEIAAELEDAGVIRSAFMLRVVLKLRGTAGELVPGEYLFEEPESVYKVASRLTRGGFGREQRKVTIPEGSTNAEIAALIKEKFDDFDDDAFLAEASSRQGYLFPETYYFLSTSTQEALDKLTDTFDYQVRDLQAEAIGEGEDWDEIVIMASILEEEADTEEDFRLVSGILWKRLAIGMALQVDAAPVTYEEPGFPPRPLSNPGLATLDAALHPAETEYLYYLTGKDGLMHYAETYEGHQENIKNFLR